MTLWIDYPLPPARKNALLGLVQLSLYFSINSEFILAKVRKEKGQNALRWVNLCLSLESVSGFVLVEFAKLKPFNKYFKKVIS